MAYITLTLATFVCGKVHKSIAALTLELLNDIWLTLTPAVVLNVLLHIIGHVDFDLLGHVTR